MNRTTSPLLQLPAEIRNRIYDFIFEDFKVGVLCYWVPVLRLSDFRMTGEEARHLLNVVYTCRQIRDETLVIWYRAATFQFNAIWVLREWLCVFLRTKKAAIKYVRFTVPCMSETEGPLPFIAGLEGRSPYLMPGGMPALENTFDYMDSLGKHEELHCLERLVNIPDAYGNPCQYVPL